MNRLLHILFQRKRWRKRFLIRNGMILLFLVLMTLIMPRSFRLQFTYEVGKPWQEENLVAPFDFAIYKSPDSIEIEKQRVAEQVVDIYEEDVAGAKESIERSLAKLINLYTRLSLYLQARENGDSAAMAQFQEGNYVKNLETISTKELQATLSQENQDKLKAYARTLAEEIYTKGYLQLDPSVNPGDFISLRVAASKEEYIPVQQLLLYNYDIDAYLEKQVQGISTLEKNLLKEVMVFELEANYLFNSKRTQAVRVQQQNLVSPIKDKITEGTVIIEKDHIVDIRTSEILNSLIREQEISYGEENRWGIILSQFLIILLISGILLAYLSVIRPRIYFNDQKLALILFTFLMVVGIMVVMTKLEAFTVRLADILGPNFNLSYIYLAPACVVPIFLSNFFGHRTGFICNLLVAMYGAVLIQQGLEFAFVQLMAGTVAVYSLRRLRKREVFFYTLAYIFLAYTISYIAFNLYSKGTFADINYRTLLLFGLNVAFTLIAYNLIYLFEQMFGVTSDLTYLELLDTNHPLLKEMARKAPGTFQHSLQVAHIAEATVNEVGGDALLTHVGALYHDIGKIANARFFIENMSENDKRDNPHDKIHCKESANIIIGHVKAGVELAHKYHLPREIIRFIETHHGTTRVEYFYRKHIEEKKCQPPEDEEQFRYHGPLPSTKEMAVLMISDSVEAASRAMKNPTPESLRNLVNSIVDYKIKDKQLENSNLTFKDIANIRKVITKQLLSIYHARIEYPKEQPA